MTGPATTAVTRAANVAVLTVAIAVLAGIGYCLYQWTCNTLFFAVIAAAIAVKLAGRRT